MKTPLFFCLMLFMLMGCEKDLDLPSLNISVLPEIIQRGTSAVINVTSNGDYVTVNEQKLTSDNSEVVINADGEIAYKYNTGVLNKNTEFHIKAVKKTASVEITFLIEVKD